MVTPPPRDVVGVGVTFGGTTRTTFGGAVCFGFGFGEVVECATGFGFGVAFGVGLGETFGLGATAVVKVGVVTNAGTRVGAAVVGTTVALGVDCAVGHTKVDDAGADAAGSAIAVLRSPLNPCQVNANAVNATTTTAKATSASVDRRGT